MEMLYYCFDGEKRIGPINLEELKSIVKSESLVWYDGLPEWTKASEIEDLKHLFYKLPPPIPGIELGNHAQENNTNYDFENKENKKRRLKIFAIVSISVIAMSIFIVFGIIILKNYIDERQSDNYSSDDYTEVSYDEESNREKTLEELRQDLYSLEKQNPKSYLSVSFSLDYKVLSGEDVIKGYIYNSATIATFKDVVLLVTYKTGTGTVLSTEEFTVYQYVLPGNSTNYKIKTYSPRNTKQINVEVKGAVGE
jgi:hypothetical protein